MKNKEVEERLKSLFKEWLSSPEDGTNLILVNRWDLLALLEDMETQDEEK
jgi:hypothetical protein